MYPLFTPNTSYPFAIPVRTTARTAAFIPGFPDTTTSTDAVCPLSAEAVETVNDVIGNAGLGYLAAALSVGLGSIGCGIAVGSAAPAAIGAVAEEPKSFSKALIFVALGEGVALYGFLISFMILNAL